MSIFKDLSKDIFEMQMANKRVILAYFGVNYWLLGHGFCILNIKGADQKG